MGEGRAVCHRLALPQIAEIYAAKERVKDNLFRMFRRFREV